MDTLDRDGLDTRTETRTASGLDAPVHEALPPVTGLVIAAHPDLARVGEEAPLTALQAGSSAYLSRREPRFLPPGGESIPRPLGETFLSRRPVRLSPGPEGSVVLHQDDSPIEVRIGDRVIVGSRRFEADEIERGVVLLLAGRIVLLLQKVAALAPAAGMDFGLVGQSRAMVHLRQDIRAASLLPVPVLVRGETGTGKELVARAVHEARPGRGPYLAVNLGALVPSLAASELFGATRGAYTGADRSREGFFRRADGGTLFLDEIGEAPPEVQVMLLRTLETGRVQPVGGAAEQEVEVRVIAATDADLDAAIRDGRFRPALVHRLAGYEIRVPSLRDRRDEIARLLLHFLAEASRTLVEDEDGAGCVEPWLPAAPLVARLLRYDWPGNVRELQNVARRLAVWQHVGDTGQPGALLDGLLRSAPGDQAPLEARTPEPASSRAGTSRRTGADVAAEELVRVLEGADWQPGPAAKALGLSRQALYRLIDDHPDLRTAAEVGEDELRRALAGHDSVASAARALRVSRQGLKRRMTVLGVER